MPSKSTLKIIKEMLKATDHTHQESTDKINYILYKLHKSDRTNKILNQKIDNIKSKISQKPHYTIEDNMDNIHNSNDIVDTDNYSDTTIDFISNAKKCNGNSIKDMLLREINKYDDSLKRFKSELNTRKIDDIIKDLKYHSIEFAWRVKDYFRILENKEMETFSSSYYAVVLKSTVEYIGIDLQDADNTNIFCRINDARSANSQLIRHYCS